MTTQDEANEEERRARWQALGIRTDVAHPARVYDYLLGGKDTISHVVSAVPYSGSTMIEQACQAYFSKTASFTVRYQFGAVAMEVFGHLRFALENPAPMFEITLGDLAALVGPRYPAAAFGRRSAVTASAGKMSAVSDDRSLQTLTAGDFRPHQGTRFRLTGGPPPGGSPATIETELVEVTEHGTSAPGSFRAPFSVLFHGPLQPVLPQGSYRVEHEQLGTLELFIVPVGPDEPSVPGQVPTAMCYEAVFG